jgi:NADPH:quinone reductase
VHAIVVDKLRGQPRLAELPKPNPKSDQLLVQVAASGLNPFDWKLADGIMEGVVPNVLPFVLGLDAAGIVVQLGEAVTRFEVGDRVFGQFWHIPLGQGTYAEFTVVPEGGAVALLPYAVGFETASALPTAGMTALAMVNGLNLPVGSKVLIVGATGGVGSFATQIAAAKGFKVLVTAAPANAGRMLGLGAAETFDHMKGDLVGEVRTAYPAGIDGLIDLVSNAPKLAALTSLVRKGGHVFTTVGAADEADLESKGILGGNFNLKSTPALLEWLAGAVESGKLKVPIETTIPLEDVPAAITRSRAGRSNGKTVIRINPSAGLNGPRPN